MKVKIYKDNVDISFKYEYARKYEYASSFSFKGNDIALIESDICLRALSIALTKVIEAKYRDIYKNYGESISVEHEETVISTNGSCEVIGADFKVINKNYVEPTGW